MKKFKLGTTDLNVSAIVAGCMRINNLDHSSLVKYIDECVGMGINFFDHADIYGGGNCEEIFGKAFKESKVNREDVYIQGKTCIVPGKMYDMSKEYILNSVDGILKRLNMEYLDTLLLHRPDALVEPEEVAEAFDILETSGKVRHFGVSNHKPMQIELLKKYVKQDIVANQLQFSLAVNSIVSNGMEVNMLTDNAIDRDGSVLDYCRLEDITIQAWSPFQKPHWWGCFIGAEDCAELNKVLDEIGEKYGVSATTIAAAWILRHPANIQLIAGTTSVDRMKEIVAACDINLSREDWYKLYFASGHFLP